ncbi:MAG: hypothetical protein NT023_20705 [Armatimonadetes bacterium]|nr:hypothetical protein [Armatimonadota bacterium]
MSVVQIHEGTSQELACYLAQHPERKFQLVEFGEEEIASKSPVLDEKAKATLAMLEEWIAEGLSADEATRLEADREVEEFKCNMNANRLATGERLLFP